MTQAPGNYNLTIYRGADFNTVLTWKDQANTTVNLTGYTARMMAKVTYATVTPYITLTTENGGITLGGVAGTITLSINAAATAALTTESGIYDLELVSAVGFVTRLLQGTVTLSLEVTHD